MITDLQLKQNPFFLSDEDIAWEKNTLSSLTEDEKIGQLFCLAAFSSDPQFVDYIFHVMKPGGIMYRPMKAAEAVALTHALAKKSTVPMLIAANLEAGANGAVSDGTYLGNEMQVAATGTFIWPRTWGRSARRKLAPRASTGLSPPSSTST
jgi:beta-N-acetylhexosaminidase